MRWITFTLWLAMVGGLSLGVPFAAAQPGESAEPLASPSAAPEAAAPDTTGSADTADPTGAAADPPGTVARAMEANVPETGNHIIDGAMDTLIRSVGRVVDGFIGNLPMLAIGVVILLLTGVVAGFAQRISKRAFARARLRQSLRDLFTHLIYIAIWFLGLLIALGVVFDFGMGELVATAGLVSIAIGFAFQDIFENFFAGILILWRFPFEPGDFIEIESENIEGRVEEIWIRMTLIRLTTGELVTVPNSTVYKSPIRILTNRDVRRMSVECGVAYGEDVTEAREVIRKAVTDCSTVREDHPIQVFLTGFGDSSMDYEIAWWCGATPVQQRESRDQVVEAIKKSLDAAGIEIPYPYRVLTFTRNEPLIYEQLGRAAAANENGAS